MTIAYYDLDSIDEAELARVRARRRPVREAASILTAWPERATPPRRLSSDRAQTHQDRVMAWIDAAFPSLNEALGQHARARGVNLLEVLRYRLMFELAADAHRHHVLVDLAAENEPDVVWVARPANLGDVRRLLGVRRVGAALGVRVAVELLPARASLVDAARAAGYRAVTKAKALVARGGRRVSRGAVVFTDYFPNSVKAALPVSGRLNADFPVHWLAGRVEVLDALARAGVEDATLLESLAGPSARIGRLRPAIARVGTKVREAARTWGPRLVGGSARRADARALLVPSLVRILRRDLVEATWFVDAYDDSFAALRPAAVVSTTYSSVPGRAAALVAKNHGAPAVYMQHGTLPDYYVNTFLCHDDALLWGDYDRRTFSRGTAGGCRIHVTGATLYDGLARVAAEQHGSRSASQRAAQQRTVEIVYLASRTAGDVLTYGAAERTIQALCAATELIDEARLVVKPHPADHTGLLDRVVAGHERATLVRDRASQELIAGADIVVVLSSTTGFEACVLQKPLLVFDLVGLAEYVEYVSYGAALLCTSPVELPNVIHKMLHNAATRAELADGRRRLLDDLLDGAAGHAVEKATHAIKQILEERAAV